MSETLHDDGGGFAVTTFYGGDERGPMVQITDGPDYVQLTVPKVMSLCAVLAQWIPVVLARQFKFILNSATDDTDDTDNERG